MALFRLICFSIISGLFLWLLQGKAGPFRAVYTWFNPIDGLSANLAEPEWVAPPSNLSGLKGAVEVYISEDWVPQIHADSHWDAYFMQGYLTAKLRLFQMDFVTRFAAGELAEIVGEKALHLDIRQRHKGLSKAAENALIVFEKDSLSLLAMNAYTAGVNAWLHSAKNEELPLECKLLQYRPKPWTNFRSALLLKYMADLLTGEVYDLEMHEVLMELGPAFLAQWYPDINPFPAAAILPNYKGDKEPDSLDMFPSPFSPFFPHRLTASLKTKGLGSNNWVLDGTRTSSGKPLLANDPHLPLNLPSIWLEMELVIQGKPVYGASLPGAPGIIIGMNQAVAWGVTNGTVDVKDYVALELSHPFPKDSLGVSLVSPALDGLEKAQNPTYASPSGWKEFQFRKETISIKGKKDYTFFVPYTETGPLVQEEIATENKIYRLSFQWTGFEPSNELRTFLLLNQAKSLEDFYMALETFKCPPQNFIYADTSGNIALWQKGLFPNRKFGQGKSVGDGRLEAHYWNGYFPDSLSPKAANPNRGFLFSANQHPTGNPFPYAYTGFFEFWRNQRIASVLEKANLWSVDQMMALQMDGFSEEAHQLLPLILQKMDAIEHPMLDSLGIWDYVYGSGSQTAAFFHQWLANFEAALWNPLAQPPHVFPERWVLIPLLKDSADLLTSKLPNPKLNLAHCLQETFEKTLVDINHSPWGKLKSTKLSHLARLESFSVSLMDLGGHHTAPNAMTSTNGPSWRMVVDLSPPASAWVCVPGGSSGNPASALFEHGISDWAKGHFRHVIPGKIPNHPKHHWQCAP